MYKLPGKIESSTFSTQICLKKGFRFEISENQSQNKNQYPRYLSLKLEKANVGIRISILKIHVCQFSGKMNKFDFSGPNLPKNGFLVVNSEN